MAKEGGMGIGEILLLGVGAYLLYNWYVNSQTVAAAPAATVPPASGPATTVTTGPAAPPAAPPATPVTSPPAAPPVSPAAANTKWSIVGPVTTNINNSLSANVNINGTITNVSIIFPSMTAWNTSGQNVTAQLTAMGVNVPALAAAMQAAYTAANPGSAGVSGLGWWGFLNGAVPGLGQVRRPMAHAPGRNYLRRGAPMRRIG
jgi:hypothetical protein